MLLVFQFILPVGVAFTYLRVDGKRVSEHIMGNHIRRVLSKPATSFALAARTSGKSSQCIHEISQKSFPIKKRFLGRNCPRIIPA